MVSTDAQPEKRPTGLRQTAILVVVVAAIAGAGGAAIYAATDQLGGGRHQPWHPPNAPGSGPAADARRTGPAAIPDESLHGEFVAPAPGGGYRTTVVQTGTITAISPSSITTRSADGYTQTYVIPPTAAQGPASFAVDQVVTVRATRDGQVATVTNIGFADPPAG